MFEVVSKYSDYLEQDKQNGINSFCITNHGNIAGWVKRKEAADKNNMKYIHGIEAYVTENLDEKLGDNYHLILLAKNWEGVKEINILSSSSFGGRGLDNDDNHFYRKPRMSREEIFNTSDNIIILTACLGSPLWQTYKGNFTEEYDRWVDFFVKNKYRVWLEVQPHNTTEQKLYNKLLLDLADKHDMNIVATNDVHALNEEHEEIRTLLQKSKNAFYEADEGEEKEELWAKDTQHMVDSFKLQGVLNDNQIEEAINNTQVICDQVENFELNRDIRYPKLYDDSTKVFQDAIKIGVKRRGIDKMSVDQQKIYAERIKKEYNIFQTLESTDFMLLEWNISQWIRDNGMYTGPGRGSAAGSLISYLLEITDLDPVKHTLSVERFVNPHRSNLADIDSDMYSEDRWKAQKYLLENPDLHCASIMTVGTYALRGAIRDIGKALGYNPFETNEISKQLIEEDGETIIPQKLYDEHTELFDYAKKIEGVINNFGRHAAGILVYSEPIEDIIGTMRVKDFDYPVTQLNMKEIDGLNLVKLDMLGLDNVGLMNITEELAGLPHLSPQSKEIDFNDDNVIKSIAEDNTAIFQFEKQRSQKLLKDMFSQNVLNRIKKVNPESTYVELLSLLTAVIRPSGGSIIDDVVAGNFIDNGHPALNKFLRKTQGALVYQEQMTSFLVEFCGWDEASADIIRRGMAKKKPEIMDEEVPKIKPTFIKTMIEKYDDTPEHAEKIADRFIQIFMDSVNYGFNKSHAYAYSYISYISAWLRYYYPLEFCTAALQIWKNNQEKTNSIIAYAKKQGIEIKPPRFRRSKGDYFFDKDENAIYQGTAPIKDNNAQVGDLLYEIKNKKFNNFVDFLIYIRDNVFISNTDNKLSILDVFAMDEDQVKKLDKDIKADQKLDKSIINIDSSKLPINKTKILSLIRLNFFEEFGTNKKLEKIFTKFDKTYKPNNKTFISKYKKYHEIVDYAEGLPDEQYPIFEECEFQLYYNGRLTIVNKDLPAKYAFVISIDKRKTRTSAIVYNINKGIEVPIKVGAKVYRNVPFKEGDLLEIVHAKSKPKMTKQNGQWIKHPTDKDLWVDQLVSIRKGSFN